MSAGGPCSGDFSTCLLASADGAADSYDCPPLRSDYNDIQCTAMVVDRTSCETQTTTQSSEGSTAFATSPASKGRCTDHEPGCPAEERQHDVGRAHDILQRLGSFLSKEFFLVCLFIWSCHRLLCMVIS